MKLNKDIALEKHVISKSSYIRGLQCEKYLYLYVHNYDLMDEQSEGLKQTFSTGQNVGEYAQKLFPNGINCGFDVTGNAQKSVELTSKTIADGCNVIYEAAFQYKGVLIIADILVKSNNGWRVYEVKSSVNVYDYHYDDAAVQYYVIKESGLNIEDISIVHLNNKYIKQVVINKIDKKRLKERTGMDSVVVGDTFDFDSELDKMDGYSEKWREDFGILDDELVFLQATRIVSRKKIELAMDLVKKLDDKRIVLVLAGYEGDEIGNYGDCLRYYVGKLGIRTMFIADRIGSTRKLVSGKRRYTLWDCYVNCDFVTYPSILEGFGNQFLEAMYFRKPVMVNRYEVYKSDIEPLGFEVIAINGRVTEKVVVKTREWLEDKEKVKKITEKNFRIAKKYFSYEAREKQLRELGL